MFEVARKNDGEGFGEKALQNDQKRTATIRAMSTTYCAVISKENFD